MGSQKRLLEDGSNVCPECGADMSENEDGELECDNPGFCQAQQDVLDGVLKEHRRRLRRPRVRPAP